MNKGIIAGGIAVVGAVVGLLTFTIGNYAGQPEQTTIGRVVEVKHRYNSSSKSYKWKIEVRVVDGKDTLTRTFRPDWARKGRTVQVTYQVGRWVRDINIKKVR